MTVTLIEQVLLSVGSGKILFMTPSNSVRYFPNQDRLSVITAVILLAYTLTRFVDIPTREISATLFGSSIGFELNGQIIILAIVAALISTGSDTLIRSHPKSETTAGGTVPHWILPGASALGLGLLLNLEPLGPVWWIGLGISALFLVLVLVAEYTVVEPNDRAYQAAAFGLTALTYIIALALFSWLRYTSTRAALSGTATAFLAALLSLRLLLLSGLSFLRGSVYASVVGLVVGETMWALNYWRVTPVSAGLLLLVQFYILHGLVQQHLIGGITRRMIIEFAVVGLIGVVIAITLAAPR